ncbi:tetratricopeptide repeat-containing response regulator [Balneatrix alpica]|uniref:tetratricopeptide repeat-containing response regulator n=1 Tax=Balneatrix alpica TaxID=75684 RepID=UPI002739D06A|nr:tetratricopeptide repeat-containing response regulator [Balneatrix alpica]
MSRIDYSNKRFLVIDDLVEARSMVRDALKEAGATKIDIAMSANAAMEYLRTRKYDLILSDYNLGKGRDGQQILEESRLNQLVPNVAAFIMITAETTPEMVMGALEYQPDGYITKPFTRAELSRRIERMLKQKEALRPINELLDKQDWAAALEQTNQLLESQPGLSGKLMRIKGNLLLENNQYKEARQFYTSQLKDRRMPWALYGLARACYHMQDYDKAIEYLEKLMMDNEYFVRADDLLAQVKLAQKRPQEAQEILQNALLKSSKAVLRQMELGKVASLNQDWSVAEVAYKKAIMLAKHSVYRTPENYLGLANTIIKQLEQGQSPPRQSMAQMEEALKTVHEDFSREWEARGRALDLAERLAKAQQDNKGLQEVQRQRQELLAQQQEQAS